MKGNFYKKDKSMEDVFPNRINGVIKARLEGLIAQIEESKQVSHASTKGTLREKYLIDFLQNILPQNYTVTGGFICDVLGKISPQIDLILSDTSTIPSIAFTGDVSLIPIEAAIGIVEVKSTLKKEDYNQLKKQSDAIRSMRPCTEFSPEQTIFGIRMFVFAYESELSIDSIKDWFKQVQELFGVCIIGKTFIYKSPQGICISEKKEKEEVLIFISSLLHAIVKSKKERLPQTINIWRRYIVGVDPSLVN